MTGLSAFGDYMQRRGSDIILILSVRFLQEGFSPF